MNHLFKDYSMDHFYDELITAYGRARPPSTKLLQYLKSLSNEEVIRRRQLAEVTIKQMGVSFTVYSEAGNIDRNWPFDIIPRTIASRQWRLVESGLSQRLNALNLFIDDLYHKQQIIKDKILPAHIIGQSKHFLEECVGARPKYGVWAHICGTDLVRDERGEFLVLEDNLRVPSGVSYVLENRAVTKRVLPEIFEKTKIEPVNAYTDQLASTLSSLSPRRTTQPNVVILTPGIFNSAYFEHAYLAQKIGAELVEGADLIVTNDNKVYMKTINGLEQVDVIYRRIDDSFLDPEIFNKESVLGVPGLMRAWRDGHVALANAPGAGVADDKVVYAYVPKIIKYYLDQDPLISNVETFICDDQKQQSYVLANIHKLVVKPANESGGYGMLIGPHSSKREQAKFVGLIKENPRNYIAQPTLNLSVAPTLVESNKVEPRHLDLRPFILQGKTTYVMPGGLTRVAMQKGSLVVNSSQGGGSKDTWIVNTD